jgi:hypothetical protein
LIVTQQKFLFLNYIFKPSYWFENIGRKDEERVQLNPIYAHEIDNGAFEQEPNGLYASVKIENLTKVLFI